MGFPGRIGGADHLGALGKEGSGRPVLLRSDLSLIEGSVGHSLGPLVSSDEGG